MLINTKHFGEIEINEEDIIIFEEGIPGIKGSTRYALLINSEQESPFFWLQSIDDKEVAFALVNPIAIYPDYSPKVDIEVVKKLGEPKEEDLIVSAIVVVPEDITKMTVNLKAPLVINRETQKGMQVIVDNEEYHIRHNLYEQIVKLQQGKEGE
jgi:flagellar assembly factor FliW